jgi:hypothetical protein
MCGKAKSKLIFSNFLKSLLFVSGEPKHDYRQNDADGCPGIAEHENSTQCHALDKGIHTVTPMIHNKSKWA